MRPLRLGPLLCMLGILALVREGWAQTDPENPPQPPVERLARLQPFFGLYTHAGQTWEGVGPFAGTLEVGPAVKGWYVEWVINTHHRAIDRQLRMLLTWDDELERYRVWRFSTVPQQPPGSVEGEVRFVGDTLVMEWADMRGPAGQRGSFRNRVFLEGRDELVIISDALPEGASEWIRLGVWRNERRM